MRDIVKIVFRRILRLQTWIFWGVDFLRNLFQRTFMLLTWIFKEYSSKDFKATVDLRKTSSNSGNSLVKLTWIVIGLFKCFFQKTYRFFTEFFSKDLKAIYLDFFNNFLRSTLRLICWFLEEFSFKNFKAINVNL